MFCFCAGKCSSPPTLPSLLFPLGFFKDCSSCFSPKRSHHTFLWARFYCQSSSNISWTWRNQYCPSPTKAVLEKEQWPASCCVWTSGWPVPIPVGCWWHTEDAGRGTGAPGNSLDCFRELSREQITGVFSVLLPEIQFPLLSAPKSYPEKAFSLLFSPTFLHQFEELWQSPVEM